MSRFAKLVQEVHRRSLWQVFGIYLAGSWVALQVVEQLAEAAGLPDWVRPLALILLIVGVPVVLATAFVQEGMGRGPDGSTGPSRSVSSVATEAAPDPRPTHHRILTWRNALLGGLCAFALLGFVSAGWLIFGGAVPDGVLRGPALQIEDRPSVAALPFVNLSSDGEHSYFADGIHEQILMQLSKIGSLKVISRTSVMEFRDDDGSISGRIPDIAAQLGVRNVLEGSVQRDADRVRITVQLIDAETDEHLWAETYDRTLEDIFAVQSELATAIASELDATLSPEEDRQLAARPTESTEAYTLLLRGDDYLNRARVDRRYDSLEVALAREMYESAIESDPGYALPHARLSLLNNELYWWTDDRTPERLELAGTFARESLVLDPDLPDGYMALGRYHYRHRRYPEALEAYSAAESLRPGEGQAVHWVGMTMRRMGRWDEAVDRQHQALALDPLNVVWMSELDVSLRRMRRWDETLDLAGRRSELFPDGHAPYFDRAMTYANGFGDVETARGMLDLAREKAGEPGAYAISYSLLESAAGNHEAALEWLDRAAERRVGVSIISPLEEMRGVALAQLGRTTEAREAFEAALTMLEAELADRPDDRRLQSALGRVYAQLGLRDEAVAAATRGTEMSPLTIDPLDGSYALEDLAVVYTIVGDHEAAMEAVDQLLGMPYYLTVEAIRYGGVWAPLLERDDFQALLARHEAASD
ncbi:MAG: tetratricopeptide repeat protein [Gemmatimonadota bacterium]|nr:tetratricopeptide repeat protein [Gemmatimonadota bacterium]